MSLTFHLYLNLFDRDKKKDFAPNCAAFNPFGADIFLCQRKIDHIARFVELPAMSMSGEVPPILVVNIQVHIYKWFLSSCSLLYFW